MIGAFLAAIFVIFFIAAARISYKQAPTVHRLFPNIAREERKREWKVADKRLVPERRFDRRTRTCLTQRKSPALDSQEKKS